MGTGKGTLVVVLLLTWIISACDSNDFETDRPQSSTFSLNGEVVRLKDAFMDVSETSLGNYEFEIFFISKGMDYDANQKLLYGEGDVLSVSLGLEDRGIPSGTSFYVYQDLSDPNVEISEVNSIFESNLNRECLGETCTGPSVQVIQGGWVEIKRAAGTYYVEFSLEFAEGTISGNYNGTINRRF